MSNDLEPPRELTDAARQRIQRWLTSPGLREHLQTALDAGRRPLRTGPFIAISREAGTDGSSIARQVSLRLGWDLLDKELLDFMAECYGMPRAMLEFVDETRASWLRDALSSWLDVQVVSHEKFVVYLERIMFLAAIYGHIVFVGRGAHWILPRNSGLSVRLVAPLEFRIARLMNNQGKSRKEAQKLLTKTDADRSEFYRRFFHHDVGDAQSFDLTINVARYSHEAVCDLIVAGFESVDRESAVPVSKENRRA